MKRNEPVARNPSNRQATINSEHLQQRTIEQFELRSSKKQNKERTPSRCIILKLEAVSTRLSGDVTSGRMNSQEPDQAGNLFWPPKPSYI